MKITHGQRAGAYLLGEPFGLVLRHGALELLHLVQSGLAVVSHIQLAL